MRSLADCRLYAFVDTTYLRGRAPETVAAELCDGGADLIQLRAKESPPDEVRRMAEVILPVVHQAGVGLVINDHPGIALGVGADYCHLGQEDFFGVGHTRVTDVVAAGSHLRIGLSSHAPEQAQRAIAAGAHYLGVGPVYATGTKPGAKPATLEYVRWAAANLALPWFAIGGINLGTLDAVLEAGATRICVVSAILDTDNVSAACARFKARLG
jgi:thiamine-phosphate pyrophosphorylase